MSPALVEMNAVQFKSRTFRFAASALRFCASLPRQEEVQVVRRQLMRSATSIGANYRAACRARSRAEFVSKMGIVEEEADETLYWLDLLGELGITAESLPGLRSEAEELLSLTVASIRTARQQA